MIITHHKAGFIKLTSGDTTIAFNPISKESKLKEVKFGADIAFVSINHLDCNGVDTVTRSGKNLFVIDGPGEYESVGVFAKGVGADSIYGGDKKINTIYSLHIEDTHIVYLGALSTEKLTSKMLQALDNIDILFVPIGGDGVLEPGVAHKISNSLEPKMIVPIFYNNDSLQTFLKESGTEETKAIEKLMLKKKDLEGKSGEVVVLSTQ